MLADDAVVYKLVGSVLIKQDQVEATSHVKTRLDFIRGELERLQSQRKGWEERQAKKKAVLQKLQQEIEAARQGQ
jgi:prefoldin beta subunit